MFLTVQSPVLENAGTMVGAGALSLGAPLGTNLTVMLYSTDTNQIILPDEVTILAGTTNSAFDVTAVDDGLVNGPRSVPIMAATPGYPSVIAQVLIADDESPIASNLSFTISANAQTNLLLSGIFSPSNSVIFQVVLPPTRGLLSAYSNNTGIFVYTPNWAFSGSDEFTYAISDGVVTSAPALVSITITPLADLDADGIADVWEGNHAFALGDAQPNDDDDGDGLSNLFEYLTSTDPFDARSGLQSPEIEVMAGGAFRLKWKSVGSVRYRLQYSDGDAEGNYDGVFTDVVRSLSAETDASPPGVPSQMQFIDDFTLSGGPPASGRRYYRLQVGW